MFYQMGKCTKHWKLDFLEMRILNRNLLFLTMMYFNFEFTNIVYYVKFLICIFPISKISCQKYIYVFPASV